MSELHDGSDSFGTIFDRRNECGLYDELANSLQAMGKSALGNVDCPEDFVRYQASYGSNIDFRNQDGFEFRTAIVGEIGSPKQGTVMRAIGNYYVGQKFQPIDDTKKTVKDVIALVMPTCATVRLANFFNNQTIPLRDAIDQEEDIESKAVPYQEFISRPWMRSLGDDSAQDDIIVVHMMPKYGLPAAAGTVHAAPVARRAKRKLDDVLERAEAIVPARTVNTTVVSKPRAADIKLGAYYDPRLLEDYGGDYFRHVKARLLQLDVRDATADRKPGVKEDPLVPPWDFYSELRPGTLILVNATLHIFVMNDVDSKGVARPKKRKIYQINAHSIKILGHSDLPVEKRSILVPPGFEGTPSNAVPPPPEFTSFSLKTKIPDDKSGSLFIQDDAMQDDDDNISWPPSLPDSPFSSEQLEDDDERHAEPAGESDVVPVAPEHPKKRTRRKGN